MSSSDQIVMIDNDVIDERIEIVKRQTSYSHDEAKAALQKNNYDVMSCIREYLEVPNKKQESKKSLNQQIYIQNLEVNWVQFPSNKLINLNLSSNT